MKTMAKSSKTPMHLFKHDLKFMDFHQLTFCYLDTTPLKGESKISLAVRIHDYVSPMQDAILNYGFSKTKQAPKTYEVIESGMKETLRRAKISLALNDNQSKFFIGYWKFLAGILHEDANRLKDEQLQGAIRKFEQNVLSLKVKN